MDWELGELNASIDEAATLLLQAELSDPASLEELAESLAKIVQCDEPTAPRAVLELLTAAIDALRADSPNLDRVGELIESAQRDLEALEEGATDAPPGASAAHQDAPATTSNDKAPPASASCADAALSVGLADNSGVRPADELPDDADLDLLSAFVEESQEGLDGAESALLNLESHPGDVESVNVVFRAFHSIKGTAAFLGLMQTSHLAHYAEDLLSRVRDGELTCAGQVATLALNSVDMLRACTSAAAGAAPGAILPAPAGLSELLASLENVDALIAEDGDPLSPSSADSQPGSPPNSEVRRESAPKESSIRVRTDRLDGLIDMVGELVIAQSMIAQDDVVLSDREPDLVKKVVHAGKIVRDLQELSMSLRMLPLRSTFQKMSRIVRDAAQRCGKEVRFQTEGEDTEIDRNMVDIVNDPLVHMVRNAVDHGIEPPNERERRGKPREGTLTLRARHSGGNVFIELQEDGRGLNRERIAAKAIKNGLISTDSGMSDQAVYSLIFAPGFSTAEQVTDISGRGVGLDVVKRNIEALDGVIAVSSEEGAGTMFSLRLPLTLAVTDGMLVRVGAQRFIIPTITISFSLRPQPKDLDEVPQSGEIFRLRGEVLPVFRLNRMFGISGGIDDPTKGLLVVLHDGERRFGLLVDELLGQQQLVAKPLGDIPRIQGVSGGAILGDGTVGLILDPLGIAALGRSSMSGRSTATTKKANTSQERTAP